MKSLKTVIMFELGNFFRHKGFIITTTLLSLIFIIGLSLPSFFDMSSIIPGVASKENQTADSKKAAQEDAGDLTNYAIYDEAGIMKDTKLLTSHFADSKWTFTKSEEEVKKLVKSDKVEGGLIVKSATKFSYVVNNSSMYDQTTEYFKEVLQLYYRQNYITSKGLDFNEFEQMYQVPIEASMDILGKDSANNYWYTYGLIFIIYMMIIFYGQTIAMGVTSEKSNRAMEILVTSTDTNSLIFGKVIAGAIASVIQVTIIIGSGIISYQVNSAAWNGMLDFIFKIPANVLITFGVFGLLGFLFYCFIYGALGALVSRTEDLGKSTSIITYVFIIAFFVAFVALQASDTTFVKVASYVPFTSCIVMMVRVAMGTVNLIEVIISGCILVASIVVVGLIGAKIYRFGTLHYGNPLKLRNVLKSLKKE